MERKLATIRKIDSIEPIDGADRIVLANIGGWKVVTAKDNNFKPNDLCVYFEIDSWIPTKISPYLSKDKTPRIYNGVSGERLNTIKLRGQISQGLIIPINQLNELNELEIIEGLDLTEILGILKWERVMPAHLAGFCEGNFPNYIQKTDQERCQNLKRELIEARDNGSVFEVTVKLDGSSMTIYNNYGKPGVCSRNLELKLEQTGNTFVDVAVDTKLLTNYSIPNYAFQGELIGPGIQDNVEGLIKPEFRVFDIYDIDNQNYLNSKDRLKAIFDYKENYEIDLKHVPIEYETWSIPKEWSDEEIIPNLLKLAEGKNSANNEREGLVFKRNDGKFSFKAISNKFLFNEK